MKVMGKLASMLILVVVIAFFVPNLIIYATEPNFTMHVTGSQETTTKAKMKDQISIDIELKDGLEDKQTLGIVIVYDSSKLEAVPDIKKENELQWRNSLSNDIPTENAAIKLGGQVNISENSNLKKIVLAFCNESGLNTNGKIGTLKFNVISEGMSEIYFSGIKYGVIDNPNAGEIVCNSQSKITVISEAELEKPSDDKTSNKPIKDLDKFDFIEVTNKNDTKKVQGIQTIINNMYQESISKEPIKTMAANNQDNKFEETISTQVEEVKVTNNKINETKVNNTENVVNENTVNFESNTVSNTENEENKIVEQESINAESKTYNSEESEASAKLEEVNQEIQLQNKLINTRKIILVGIIVAIIILSIVVIMKRK